MTALIVCGSAVFGLLVFLWVCTEASFHYLFCMKRQTREESYEILKEMDTLFSGEIDENELERLTVTSEDGFTLVGYYVNRYPNAKKVVVLSHGYLSNHIVALQYAPIFLRRGYNVFVFDQRSHGESGGKYPSYGLFESRDLHLWVTLLRNRLGMGCEIGLFGHSLGGATTLFYPKIDTDIRFMIVDSTFSTLRKFVINRINSFHVLGKLFYPLVNLHVKTRCGYSMEKVNPIAIAAGEGRDIPTLFIHSKGDQVISYLFGEEIYKKRGNPHDRLYLLEDAAHPNAYADNKAAYESVVDEFLDSIQ